MKKLFVTFLAVLMLFSFSACGSQSDGEEVAAPITPFSSLQELSNAANCALIKPEGVDISDESFSIIDGDPQIAEYRFTVEGKECFLRFANVGRDTDICGIYGDDGKTLFADSDNGGSFQTGDYIIQRWFTVDGQYVFAALENGEWEWPQFDSLYSQFHKMEPKTWSSSVPFASYLALEGYYSDNDGTNAASIAIEDDHAKLTVYRLLDAGSTYWTMDVVLDGNKLVYEKETIFSSNYDENAGMTVKTPLDDGGAGYAEIKDDTLTFVNAGSEELRDLVLVKTELSY